LYINELPGYAKCQAGSIADVTNILVVDKDKKYLNLKLHE